MIVSRNTRYSPLHAGPHAGIGMHTHHAHRFVSRSAEAFVSSPRAQEVMGNVFGRKRALLDTLNALPDDTFQLVIAACGDDDGVLRFETVKGLACVSKALLQQQDRSLERRERLGEILSLSLSFAEKMGVLCIYTPLRHAAAAPRLQNEAERTGDGGFARTHGQPHRGPLPTVSMRDRARILQLRDRRRPVQGLARYRVRPAPPCISVSHCGLPIFAPFPVRKLLPR